MRNIKDLLSRESMNIVLLYSKKHTSAAYLYCYAGLHSVHSITKLFFVVVEMVTAISEEAIYLNTM